MRKQFIIILLACLVMVGLTVSCKNEVANAGFGSELVSVSFKNDSARGLTATLEAFNQHKQGYYWAYAAKKADNSKLVSGQTANYGETGEVHVWVKTDESGNPVSGLGSGGTIDYEAYKVSGFSQGYWNFKLYAYKEYDTTTKAGKDLVYQGETLNVLLKSDAVNAEGSHLVSVIVNPVQSEGNGTMVFLTDKDHDEESDPLDRIIMNTVNSPEYGTDYTVKVLSVENIVPEGATPTEYVGSTAEEQVASSGLDGVFSLPAGSYKVTVAFTNMAGTLNYARGTIVATVYSNLTTTIGGDLTEAMTYAQFDGVLNPDLVTVTAESGAITYDKSSDPSSTQVSFSSTGTAKSVTATTSKKATNKIIDEMAEAMGTKTEEYSQSLKLTLNVETVESTPTTATYEIGMSAELTSTKGSETPKTTTSDVSSVEDAVTVTIQLQPGLTDVNVLHDGHQMAQSPASDAGYGVFSYNTDNGELTIITKSFSPFKVTYTAPEESVYVAKIGNYKYTSLKNAVDNAKAGTSAEAFGDTIVLLANYTLAEGEALSKNYVALDLAGHTLTVPSGKTFILSGTGAAVITGSIALPGAESLVLSGSNTVVSDVTVTGGTISVSGTGVEIEDCVIDSGDNVAINMASSGSATIDGGTYTATSGILSNGNITVVDGVFKGTIVNGTGAGITLTGGTYNTALPEGNMITIPEGYAYKKVSDNVYNILKETVVWNETKDIEYYTLSAAFEDAENNNVLRMLNSTEVPAEIEIPASMTLSLNLNGKVITGTEHNKDKAVFRNFGNLTINGTTAGSAINADATVVASVADSTLTVNGGSYSNKYYEVNPEGKYTVGSYIFDVKGTATIDGITITGVIKGIRAEGSGIVTVSNSTADVNPLWGLFAAGNGGTLTIKSGTYTTTYSGDNQTIDLKKNGSVIIEGGTFTHSSGTDAAFVVFNSGNEAVGNGDRLKISGGTFTINNGAAGYLGYFNGSKHEVISITGENTIINVKSVSIGGSNGDGKLEYSITGGTFSSDPSTYVAPGYEAIYNEVTEMWTVLQITPERGVVSVVRVNADPVYFLNFEDAVKYVESGDTINILKDCYASYHGGNEYDFSGKNVTIHINKDVTLTCGDVTNGKFEIAWNNGAGTLKLEGPGKIIFDSNSTWGLITQEGSDAKVIVEDVTIVADGPVNGYVMTGGNLTINSGYYYNIAFATGTVIKGGFFTTDVRGSGCNIPEGMMFDTNPAFPKFSVYDYYVTNLTTDKAKYYVFNNETGKSAYYNTLTAASLATGKGDTLAFVDLNSNDVKLLKGENTPSQLWNNEGAIYDLNGHTLIAGTKYLQPLFDASVTVKNGTIVGVYIDTIEHNDYFASKGLKIEAVNVRFPDELFDLVRLHVNGVYVKDKTESFIIQKSAPVEGIKARIHRGEKDYYYTHAVSDITYVENEDYIYVNEADEAATFILQAIKDSITIERASTGIAFPEVVFASGDIETNSISGTVMEYKAIEAPMWEVVGGTLDGKKYSDLLGDKGAAKAISATGGTIKLLRDWDLGENGAISVTTWTTSGKEYIIDFNGCTISAYGSGYVASTLKVDVGNYNYGNNKPKITITFKDSSNTNEGGIEKKGANCSSGLIHITGKNKDVTVNFISGTYINDKTTYPSAKIVTKSGFGSYGTLTVSVDGGVFNQQPVDSWVTSFSSEAPKLNGGTWELNTNTGYYEKKQ